MPNIDKIIKWNETSTEEAFRMSQAEFKGATIQALQDIRADINELKSYNTNSRYISMFIGGLAGIISGLFIKK